MGGGNTKEGQIKRALPDAWEVEGAALDRSPAVSDAPKVVVLGLDGAGKTRLANIVQGQRQWEPSAKGSPWKRYDVDVGGLGVDLCVASGFPEHRKYWNEMCDGAQHYVYVLSLSDPLRLPMAWSEMLADVNTRQPTSLLIFMTTDGSSSLTSSSVLHSFAASFAPIAPSIRWTHKEVDLSADPQTTAADICSSLSWLVSP
eukprot:TRINITY_DN6992_c0_g1_i2.p1 TRINITY_DN6992_c0_g1~~TRINITY_DN6992_c0_g1_i2.p1  ORF type:complete len:201 (+),score=58.63 TRINITY_DN6992_c0_g1_i2:615-1217(+)